MIGDRELCTIELLGVNSVSLSDSLVTGTPRDVTRHCCSATRLTLVSTAILSSAEPLYQRGNRKARVDEVTDFEKHQGVVMVTASIDNTIQLWERSRLALFLPIHKSPVTKLEVYLPSSREQLVVLSRSESKILVWEPTVDLPVIDYKIPMLNTLLMLAILGFTYYLTFCYRLDSAPIGSSEGTVTCVSKSLYAVGYKKGVGTFPVARVPGYKPPMVKCCYRIKLVLVLSYVGVWSYFSSTGMFQSSGQNFGTGSSTFEQCTTPDEKLELMRNNMFSSLEYEKALGQRKQVSALLNDLRKQLRLVQQTHPGLYEGFYDGNGYEQVCQGMLDKSLDAQNLAKKQRAKRNELLKKQASCTQTIPGYNYEVLQSVNVPKFKVDWHNAWHAGWNALNKKYTVRSYIDTQIVEKAPTKVPCPMPPALLEEIKDVEFLQNVVRVSIPSLI